MSKAVLFSIKPKYCELIASGKKTVEVRKTRPKIDVPFKGYIYCMKEKNQYLQSRNNMFFYLENKDFIGGHGVGLYQRLNGKVIGEFVCDTIDTVDYNPSWYFTRFGACLEPYELWEYGKGKPLYGFHISDLVIYDKPKELSEFYTLCYSGCNDCKYQSWDSSYGGGKDLICTVRNKKPFTRPPQSWGYVEELI